MFRWRLERGRKQPALPKQTKTTWAPGSQQRLTYPPRSGEHLRTSCCFPPLCDLKHSFCGLPWKWIISQLTVKRWNHIGWFPPLCFAAVFLLWPSQTAEELPGPRCTAGGRGGGVPDTNSTLLPPTARCRQKHCLVVTDTITLDESPGFYFIRHHVLQIP